MTINFPDESDAGESDAGERGLPIGLLFDRLFSCATGAGRAFLIGCEIRGQQMALKKRGRKAKLQNHVSKPQPGGLGVVCAALRHRRQLSDVQMADALAKAPNIDPRFQGAFEAGARDNRTDKSRARTREQDEKLRAGRVRTCESGTTVTPYAKLHHYAKLAGVSTSSLYVCARFSSLLSEAANSNAGKRAQVLAKGRDRANALIGLAELMLQMIDEFEDSGLNEGLYGEKLSDDWELIQRRYAVVNMLLDGYRCVAPDPELTELFAPFSKEETRQSS